MRALIAALLLLQQPEPPKKKDLAAREVLSSAKAAAKKWAGDAFLHRFNWRPADPAAYVSGRAKEWEFVFGSRSGLPLGQIRTRIVTAKLDDAKGTTEVKIADKDTVLDPPYAASLGEDWMDTPAVLKAFDKIGVKAVGSFELIELANECGRLFWRGHARDEKILLDAKSGALIVRGSTPARGKLLAGTGGMKLPDLETAVRAELARWKGTPEPEIRDVRAVSYDPKSFVSTLKVDEAELLAVVGEEHRCIVNVAGGQAYWVGVTPHRGSGRPTQAALKTIPLDRLKSALARSGRLSSWLEAAKEPRMTLHMGTATELMMTYESANQEAVVLTFDVATGTVR